MQCGLICHRTDQNRVGFLWGNHHLLKSV
jgi:hypothetical protein